MLLVAVALLPLACQSATVVHPHGQTRSTEAIKSTGGVDLLRSKNANRGKNILNTKLFEAAQALAPEMIKLAGRYGQNKMVLAFQGSDREGWWSDWFFAESPTLVRRTVLPNGRETRDFEHAVCRASNEDGRDTPREIRVIVENGMVRVEVKPLVDLPLVLLFTAFRDGLTPEAIEAADHQRYIAYSELYFGDARLVGRNLAVVPGLSEPWSQDIRTGEDVPWPEGEEPPYVPLDPQYQNPR